MKSLATALRILMAFAGERSSWSVRDLCSETQLNKSQVSKMLSQFRQSGLLQQDAVTRDYSVAPIAVALAGNYLKSSQLCREAVGPMRRLVASLGQTVTLCAMVGDRIMYLLSVEGPPFIDHGWRVGGWLPFHCTAAGQVLAAALSEVELRDMIKRHGLPRYTPNTICDPDLLRQRLAEVQGLGLAVTYSEGTPGLGALAAPVLAEGQEVVAALGAVYPQHLVSTDQLHTYARKIQDTARQMSGKMGALVYPYGGPGPVRLPKPLRERALRGTG